jgi:hypothetical protein
VPAHVYPSCDPHLPRRQGQRNRQDRDLPWIPTEQDLPIAGKMVEEYDPNTRIIQAL